MTGGGGGGGGGGDRGVGSLETSLLRACDRLVSRLGNGKGKGEEGMVTCVSGNRIGGGGGGGGGKGEGVRLHNQ